MTLLTDKAHSSAGSAAEAAALGRLEVILLSLLSIVERTGYDVRKWLDRHGVYMGYSTQTSQIYRQLGKLVERNWAVQIPDPRSTGPDAKLYRITETGRGILQGWRDSPYIPSPRPLDPDFQVRLRFAGSMGPDKALELVRTELRYRREQGQDRLFDIGLTERDYAPHDDLTRQWNEELWRLQSERGHYMVSNLISWLEATEARLVAMTSGKPGQVPDTEEQS